VKRQIRIYLLTVMLIVLLTSISFYFEHRLGAYANSTEDSDSWPMYRHDPQHTGYSTSSAPNTDEVKWIYNTTYEIVTSPAVANGRVIVAASNGDVIAINSTTGELLWTYVTGPRQNSMWSSPTVNSGRVFVGSRNNNFYCLNESNGMLLWSYMAGDEINSSPVVEDDSVFFCTKSKMYCLNASNGSLIWNYTNSNLTTDCLSSPAILDGTVFVGFGDSNVYAFNASTGETLWLYPAGSPVTSSPCINYGKLYFGSDEAIVFCLDASTGSQIWNTTTGDTWFAGFYLSSPAVTNDRLFIGAHNGNVYCLNATTGLSIWEYATGREVWSSPAVADGKVFIGSADGKIYCFNESTGDLIWSHYTLERIVSSPAISEGTVFVGCGGSFPVSAGRVYAFGTKYSLPASLTLSLDAETSLLGFKVTMNGILKSNETGIEGASVLLSYSVNGGQTWNDITSAQTSSDGSYSAAWIPSATGTFLVRASWAGYYPFVAAESSKMLSVIAYDDQYVFSVSSNSTLSALAFNSTSRELSFTVTGETGTTGFVKVAIAKSLVANIADLRVYLDGASLDYTVESTDSSWVLDFIYTHSTHSVTINLGNLHVSPSELFPITWLIAAVVIVAVVGAGLAVYFKKRGRK
jgi:outer membrane protein assembly factor BamB